MTRTFLTALILISATVPVAGEEKASSGTAAATKAESSAVAKSDETSSKDSPLVRAAKSSKLKRGSGSPVITDADVKKSKGKLSVISSRELPKTEEPPAETAADEAVVAKVSSQKAKDGARERFEKAQNEVATLERELATAEEDYYNEDDATTRDQVIEARFDRAKKQLDAAREELASAREALQKLE